MSSVGKVIDEVSHSNTGGLLSASPNEMQGASTDILPPTFWHALETDKEPLFMEVGRLFHN